MTDADELERYLLENIPLTRAMALSVVEVSPDAVVLHAPLAPNVNLHATAFGGSVASLATLAAWSVLHVRLRSTGVSADVVIQRGTTEYLHPITGEFTARGSLAPTEDWPLFQRMLARKGKARMSAVATLDCAGREAARFSGEFVAVRKQD